MINKLLYPVVVIVLLSSFVTFNSCKPSSPPPPEFPTYNYYEPISNPPDVFEILYNLTYMGDQLAYVTFKTDAVWAISKLGDVRIYLGINNETESFVINSTDTLALKSGYTYKVIANNNNYTEFNNFFVHFSKLNIDYDTFEPKF